MSIIDQAKEISDLIKKYNDIELYQKILDLRDEIFALREENLFLKEKIKNYEVSKDISDKLVREGNVYYLIENESSRKGPFCLACWDSDKKLINLIVQNTNNRTTIRCGRCTRGKNER